MTFLAFIALALLSLLNSGLRLYAFPLSFWLWSTCFYRCGKSLHKVKFFHNCMKLLFSNFPIFQAVSRDKTGCTGAVCLPYYLPLMITGLIDWCLLLIVIPLVISFYCLFGVADYITHKLQNGVARIKLKDIQFKEFLMYTYLRYLNWFSF